MKPNSCESPGWLPIGVLAALTFLATQVQAQTPPTITLQPTNKTVLAGSNVTFNVSVDGTGPLTYQWRFNGADLPNLITTVAGSGQSGYAGDHLAATNAKLNAPYTLTSDAAGRLYLEPVPVERSVAELGRDRRGFDLKPRE